MEVQGVVANGQAQIDRDVAPVAVGIAVPLAIDAKDHVAPGVHGCSHVDFFPDVLAVFQIRTFDAGTACQAERAAFGPVLEVVGGVGLHLAAGSRMTNAVAVHVVAAVPPDQARVLEGHAADRVVRAQRPVQAVRAICHAQAATASAGRARAVGEGELEMAVGIGILGVVNDRGPPEVDVLREVHQVVGR